MLKRIIAIAFIFACTSVAWIALGATNFARSNESDATLRQRISSNWGTQQAQQAPSANTWRTETRTVPVVEPVSPGTRTTEQRTRTETVRIPVPLVLEQTRATADLDLDHRRKGLMWYSTYSVAFSGSYRFRNATESDQVNIEFKLPTAQAIYDDLRVSINGTPATYETAAQAIVTKAVVRPGDSVTLAVAYRSQGLDSWRYVLGSEVTRVSDFELVMRTDFDAVDFPENTLSPTTRNKTAEGWEATWQYTNLLSGFQIGMTMPEKLQPGPLAAKISLFAPVSLLFFFAVLFIIVTVRGLDLHPMNYLFLAAAFFAFHLLISYLVDHISIHLAFLVASVVSVGLVVSYLRLVVGEQFAFREAALAQVIYLVAFSYAFFYQGFTGLAVTIGSIITLFVAMQMTGRIRWSELFAQESARMASGVPASKARAL